jgi:hypothetical protein
MGGVDGEALKKNFRGGVPILLRNKGLSPVIEGGGIGACLGEEGGRAEENE